MKCKLDSSSHSTSITGSECSLEQEDCNITDCGPGQAKSKPKKCGASKGKCAKPGKVTRNPFFNFLREYRQQNCGKSMVKIAKEAGAAWRKMCDSDKEKYRKMACSAPKPKKSKRSKSRKKGCRY